MAGSFQTGDSSTTNSILVLSETKRRKVLRQPKIQVRMARKMLTRKKEKKAKSTKNPKKKKNNLVVG